MNAEQWNKVEFTFYTEEGVAKMTHAEYEQSAIRDLVGRQATPPKGRNTCFLGTNILSYSASYLKGNATVRKTFAEAEAMYYENPLKYFVPSSVQVVGFLNWTKPASFKILHAGWGTGKSVSGCIDMLLSIVPTEKDWPIFSVYGVERREYTGPLVQGGVAVVSFEVKNHQFTLWPQVIKRWTPPQYIREYLNGRKAVLVEREERYCEVAAKRMQQEVFNFGEKS